MRINTEARCVLELVDPAFITTCGPEISQFRTHIRIGILLDPHQYLLGYQVEFIGAKRRVHFEVSIQSIHFLEKSTPGIRMKKKNKKRITGMGASNLIHTDRLEFVFTERAHPLMIFQLPNVNAPF